MTLGYIKTWNFRIDAVKQYLGEAIDVIRQDTYSNRFVISCLNNGYPIDMTDLTYATVTFTKADGFVVVSTADVVDAINGRIEVDVDYQAITAIGICSVVVKLFFGVTITTLTAFPINVILDPYVGTDGGVASSSEYPVLTQLVIELTEAKNVIVPSAEVEAARQAAEAIRASNENTRLSAETTRVTQESSRLSAESTRGTAESSRLSAETSRISAESTRSSNESTRVTNESARSSAESTRLSSESTRVSNESSRATAESGRVTAENGRVSAENSRVSAESTRAANEIVREQFDFKDAYSAVTQYKENNIVTYNGSSYICIATSTGNLPTNATYFKPLATKGVDGTIIDLVGQVTVTNASWVASGNATFPYKKDVAITGVVAADKPISFDFTLATLEVAISAGISYIEAYAGGVTLYAASTPTGSVTADYVIRKA